MHRYIFIFKIKRVYRAFKQIHSIYKIERPNVMTFKYKVNLCSLSSIIRPSCRNRYKKNFWRASLSCFAASVNEFYNFWQCTYAVFILQGKEFPNCHKRAETSVVINVLVVSYLQSVLILLPFLTIAVHGSFTRTKQYPVNSIWLLQ
jgi:hypothetical protein